MQLMIILNVPIWVNTINLTFKVKETIDRFYLHYGQIGRAVWMKLLGNRDKSVVCAFVIWFRTVQKRSNRGKERERYISE